MPATSASSLCMEEWTVTTCTSSVRGEWGSGGGVWGGGGVCEHTVARVQMT